MKKHRCPISAQLVIPASFAECITYEKQILWLKKEIDNLSGGGDPAAIAELRNQIALLEQEIDSIKETLNEYNIEAIEQSIAQLEMNVQLVTNFLADKQDKLTFDEYPEAESENPVTSGGIHQAIYDEGMRLEQLINDKVSETTFNDVIDNITDNYTTNEDLQTAVGELATKQELTGYATTESLGNYATKAEISDMETKTDAAATYATKSELSGYATKESLSGYATTDDISGLVTDEELQNATSTLATKEELAGKQNELSFDATPTEGSLNPVTSAGIYEALQNVSPEGYLENTVLEDSENAVRSSGIYQFVKSETQSLATKDELGDYASKADLSGYVTTESLGDYATKAEISDMETKTDAAATYATKSELGDYATKAEISDMETKTDAAATYATKAELGGYATTESLSGYVTTEQLGTATADLATKAELSGKQDTLVFDTTPTADSTNPVTSDGIKKAIDAVATSLITVDSTVSQSSENPVTSNGIYNFVLDQMGDLVTTEQLATKQDKLTFDQTPTAGSSNPVTSGGIKSYVDEKTSDMATKTELANYATTVALQSATDDMETKSNAAATYATKTELADKQDVLEFDYRPEEGSLNPVYSDGIYTAIEETKEELRDVIYDNLADYATTTSVNRALANKQDVLVFDDVPTAGSQNPVRSAGIFDAINNASGKNVLFSTGLTHRYSIPKYDSSGSSDGEFSGESELILNIPEGQETLLLNPDANFSTVGMFNIDLPVSELSGDYTYFKISVASSEGFQFAVGPYANTINIFMYLYTFEYGVVVGYKGLIPSVIGTLQQKTFTGNSWVGTKNINRDISTFDTVVITFPVKVLVKSKSSIVLT